MTAQSPNHPRQTPPISAAWGLFGLAWAAALFGTLQIHNYPELGRPLGCDICGPWGCAAKPEALVGFHLFWLTLLCPAGFLLGKRLGTSGRRAGVIIAAIGGGLTLAIAGWAIAHCLLYGPESLRQYWLQIAGFRLATNTDFPTVQIALAGLACWTGGKSMPAPVSPDTPPDPDEQSPAAAERSRETP